MNSHAQLELVAILKSCEVLLMAFSKQLDLLYKMFPLERTRESDEYALKTVFELSKNYLAAR